MARKRVEWVARRCNVPVDAVLAWIAAQGLPYRSPKDQMSDEATASAIEQFGGGRKPAAASTTTRRGPGRTAQAPERRRDVPSWYPQTTIVNDLPDWQAAAMASVDAGNPMAGRDVAPAPEARPRVAHHPDYAPHPEPIAPVAARKGKTARDHKKQSERGVARVLKACGLSGVDLSDLLDAVPDSAQELLRRDTLRSSDARRLTHLINEHVAAWCGDAGCATWLAHQTPDRRPLTVENAGDCGICQGSSTRRDAHRVGLQLLAHKVNRLLLVGGTQDHVRVLNEEVSGLKVRWAGGGGKAVGSEIRGRVKGAALVAIAGSTQMSSQLRHGYQNAARKQNTPFLLLPRAGLDSLADELERHFASDHARDS